MKKPRIVAVIATGLTCAAIVPWPSGAASAKLTSVDASGFAFLSTPETKIVKTKSVSPTAVRFVRTANEPGLSLGLSGSAGLLSSGTSTSIAAWDGRAHKVGAQIIRINAVWSTIAPTTPPPGFNAADPTSAGYDWSSIDQEVEDITASGFKPLIEVQGAPTWAEGPSPPKNTPGGTWDPNAADFGQFATALAIHFSGSTPGAPRVTDWQAWNEPNLSEYLNPQWTSSDAPASPGIYRGLENAFYASLKAASAENYVVAAGTAPYGNPTPGGTQMQPVTFDQNLFCLNSSNQRLASCPGPTAFDAIDDHPYVSGLCCLGPTWHAKLSGDTSIPDMYKIVDTLKAAEQAGTAVPAGVKGVWATELGWNTDPPNPDVQSASPPALVGQWATQALYILWSQGVNTVFWFQLADPNMEPASGWDSTYTEGLYYGSGTAKPAALAFQFPFMTNRRTKHLVQAWGRAPKAGMLWIQQQVEGKWKSVLKLKVKVDQVFEVPVSLTGPGAFRAVVGGIYSPAWSQAA